MFNREKLKIFMKQNRISASSLARDLYVSEGCIRHIMSGLKQPSLAMAAQIANKMACTVDSLVISEEAKTEK